MAVLKRASTATASTLRSNAAVAPKEDRPKSEFWLNFGYVAADGTTFVGLPFGLPLDDMNHRKIGGQNEEFNALMSASNDWLDDVRAECAKLEHGEEVVMLENDDGFQVRIKRANKNQGPVSRDENPFARKARLSTEE